MIAANKAKKTLKARQVPLLAMGAAFSFLIMMFNVPIPGGSTGHAVGAVLVAILVGPWAATIAVSVALVVQALLFGDGGITAIGANCFNMAFVIPFVGYATYRLVSGSSPVDSSRRVVAAFIAGYVGINVAALCAGVEFGIQPLLHHTDQGQALYCPYGLKVAVPAMLGEHLLVFGWVEALVTALVVKYLQKSSPDLLGAKEARS
jgi:cobalt/nickel transport system permease protein